MDKQLFGAFVAEQRRRQGLTQQQLAQSLHVTDKAVSKWERGLSYPRRYPLTPLAEVFHLRVDNLLTCRSETLDTSPAHDTAFSRCGGRAGHLPYQRCPAPPARCLLAAVIAVAVLVLAALSIAQRSGSCSSPDAPPTPAARSPIRLPRWPAHRPLLAGKHRAPARKRPLPLLRPGYRPYLHAPRPCPGEVTAVKSLRWSPDGRCLLLYGVPERQSPRLPGAVGLLHRAYPLSRTDCGHFIAALRL